MCKRLLKKSLLPLLAAIVIIVAMVGTAWCGTFGVYETTEEGDVSFKYQGDFKQFYCINYLPCLGWGVNGPNPNNWDGWELTDWLPTWKGEKLLVPERYQLYHEYTYGYSISDALYLETY
ncbi:hypothetical protein K8R61_03390 [bacterium]|nr:hypothetical protein [bacterium]